MSNKNWGQVMLPSERNKAVARAKNLANTRLRQNHRIEWRGYYTEEATALGLIVNEDYPPSIRVEELEEEVERLKKQLEKGLEK
jgi:hypothetical protein